MVPSGPLNDLARTCYEIAKSKGWHEDPVLPRLPTMLVNIHGEVSEAWEEVRKPSFVPTQIYYDVEKPTKPEGLPVELADVLIRVLDLAYAAGIDMDAAVAIKQRYNETRPYRHGGKRA